MPASGPATSRIISDWVASSLRLASAWAATKKDHFHSDGTIKVSWFEGSFKDFVTVRGGGYFFMPSRRAICYLAGRTSVTNWKYSIVGPQPEHPEAVPEGEGGFDARQMGL